jgi:hypothetical protein
VIATAANGVADTSVVIIVAPLLSEGFDDNLLTGRGWYDAALGTVTTAEHHGGTGSLALSFVMGGMGASPGGTMRHKFGPTDRVYLRYWVKYSANWVGSGQPSGPHEFMLVTDQDPDYVGPTRTSLTAFVEHNYQNGGVPRLATDDANNIDVAQINVDLTTVTESRATSGCNGNSDGYPTSCFQSVSQWYNDKGWLAGQPMFLPTPGPGYKNDWHKVEAYFQLNTIAGGIGQNNGIVQYWFDGQLVIDHQNVLLRTGSKSAMFFNQLIIAPQMAFPSPVAQTLWVDDLVISASRLP